MDAHDAPLGTPARDSGSPNLRQAAFIDWNVYARQYDRVVCRNRIYHALLDRLTGGDGRLSRPPPGGKALDLGGGTGHLARKLVSADDSFHVTLVDNDPTMLDLSRRNCARHLVHRPDSAGVRIVAADLSNSDDLVRFGDRSWDLVFLVHVLYAMERPEVLLRTVFTLLRPGGELRLSEPRRDTDASVLMAALRRQLALDHAADSALWADFDAVQRFNTQVLVPHLHRWTTDEMIDRLRSVGFASIAYASEEVYAGQSMLICARK